MRPIRAALLIVLAVLAWGVVNAVSDPAVRRASIKLPDWPASASPITVALISDTHLQAPDMTAGRLRRVVGQVNALHPDLIIAAGDFFGDKWTGRRSYSADEVVAPLSALRARYGVFAVLGNHDHWYARAPAIAGALAKLKIRLLRNEAIEVGPIALGGVDDRYGGSSRLEKTLGALRTLPGAKVLVAHGPDEFAALGPGVPLMLAGHTHCGQVAVPFYGPLQSAADNPHYSCGIIREHGKVLIITGGVGTSHVPVRFFAPPDVWLITLHG